MQPIFDRGKLYLRPLAQRHNGMDLSSILPLTAPLPEFCASSGATLGQRLVRSRKMGTARILLMGAHVIRAGVSRYLIDMMERGLISHLAMNGAGPIHDWELALIGTHHGKRRPLHSDRRVRALARDGAA